MDVHGGVAAAGKRLLATTRRCCALRSVASPCVLVLAIVVVAITVVAIVLVVVAIVLVVVVAVATWISVRCALAGIVLPTTLWLTTCALCNLSALLHCGSVRGQEG